MLNKRQLKDGHTLIYWIDESHACMTSTRFGYDDDFLIGRLKKNKIFRESINYKTTASYLIETYNK